MPVFLSSAQLSFPPVESASPEGLLAIGGDLSPERLMLAYRSGIFPWYSADTPILWWALPWRCVVLPDQLHLPASLRRAIRSRRFQVTIDRAFSSVIHACAATCRKEQSGTWIVPDMIAAYTRLHEAGFAHSVEAWDNGELAGGLYGIATGGVFWGESMFYAAPDASKVAFAWLSIFLREQGFTLIDCQQTTENMNRFGAQTIARAEFMRRLEHGLALPADPAVWAFPSDFFPLPHPGR